MDKIHVSWCFKAGEFRAEYKGQVICHNISLAEMKKSIGLWQLVNGLVEVEMLTYPAKKVLELNIPFRIPRFISHMRGADFKTKFMDGIEKIYPDRVFSLVECATNGISVEWRHSDMEGVQS